MASRAALAGLIAAACAGGAFADDGVVADARSGRPLEGVFVVARWRGDAVSAAQVARGCYRVQLATTGGDGRYRVEYPGWPALHPREIAFYKPGYAVEDGRDATGRTVLRSFSGRFLARFAEYGNVWGRDCPGAGRVLRPLLEAMADEAERLARAPAEREKAAAMRFELDSDALGFAEAGRRYEERVRGIRAQAQALKPKPP